MHELAVEPDRDATTDPMSIPECFHRGPEVRLGFVECSSNWLYPEPSPGGSITRAVRNCDGCPVANKLNWQEGERPELPSLAVRAVNAAGAAAQFAADAFQCIEPEQHAERMRICDSCEYRNGDFCAQCGCQLSLKARGRAFQCPVGKWPALS